MYSRESTYLLVGALLIYSRELYLSTDESYTHLLTRALLIYSSTCGSSTYRLVGSWELYLRVAYGSSLYL